MTYIAVFKEILSLALNDIGIHINYDSRLHNQRLSIQVEDGEEKNSFPYMMDHHSMQSLEPLINLSLFDLEIQNKSVSTAIVAGVFVGRGAVGTPLLVSVMNFGLNSVATRMQAQDQPQDENCDQDVKTSSE